MRVEGESAREYYIRETDAQRAKIQLTLRNLIPKGWNDSRIENQMYPNPEGMT